MTLDLHRLRLLREFASRGSSAATAAPRPQRRGSIAATAAALGPHSDPVGSGRGGGIPHRRDRIRAGGAPPVPWEFEGLATILGLVARGIGIVAIPALTLAAAETGPPRPGEPDEAEKNGDAAARGVAESPVVVCELPGTLARNIYAVARAASVRRPSVAVVLTALISAASRMGGTT